MEDLMNSIIGGGSQWTKDEEAKIVGIMPNYRNDIQGRTPSEISEITRYYAKKLQQDSVF